MHDVRKDHPWESLLPQPPVRRIFSRDAQAPSEIDTPQAWNPRLRARDKRPHELSPNRQVGVCSGTEAWRVDGIEERADYDFEVPCLGVEQGRCEHGVEER
jgi:hypothetical protein